jgi:hypothetical protein
MSFGISEIIAIVSLCISVCLGMHITCNSSCFGFNFEKKDDELDITYKNTEIEIIGTAPQLEPRLCRREVCDSSHTIDELGNKHPIINLQREE